MSYCLNPVCQNPQNSNQLTHDSAYCQSCGAELLLKQKYQAIRPIGQGGFGRTFLAVDLSQALKPRCVIKQFLPQQQGSDNQQKASELFQQEIQRLAELDSHPRIPKLLDAFEQSGQQYLIQEFIEGQNLAQELQEGVIYSQEQVVQLLQPLLETVVFMHEHHVIHRDIKPANIIHTRDGRYVLVDLGAAKVATGIALAQTGTVIGSAEYISPEQLRGKATFASDLYSLGVTCVVLLTGMSPFDLYDTIAGSWSWRNYLPQPVSPAFGQILDRLIAIPTGVRYASAINALDDLSTWQRKQPSPQTSEDESWNWLKDPLKQNPKLIQAEALRQTTKSPLQINQDAPGVISKETEDHFWPEQQPSPQTPEDASWDWRKDHLEEHPKLIQAIEALRRIAKLPPINQEKRKDRLKKLRQRDEEQKRSVGKLLYWYQVIYLIYIVGGVVYYIGGSVYQTAFKPQRPVVSTPAPTPVAQTPLVRVPTPVAQTPSGQSRSHQPMYSNTVSPFKRFDNIAPFEMLRLMDGGKTIVTGQAGEKGSGKYTLNFFDVATTQQKPAFTLSGLPDQVVDASAFSMQGDVLVFSAYWSKEPAQIWNLKTQQQLTLPQEVAKQPLLPSLDGRFIALVNEKTPGIARVLPNGEITPLVSLKDAPMLDFGGYSYSPDGSIVFAQAHFRQPLKGWSTETGQAFLQLEMPPEVLEFRMVRVAQAQGRQWIVSAGRDRGSRDLDSLYVWDMQTQKLRYQVRLPERIGDLATSPDAQTLAVQAGKALQIWDLPSGKLLRQISLNSPAAIQFTEDGKTLVVGKVGPLEPGISLWSVAELRNP